MPLLKLETSVAISEDKRKDLLASLSKAVAGATGKPEQYVLIASVLQMRRIEIGRLGRFDIIPGYYAYLGSAFGSGGLRARLGHHLESTADPHWHIDYLLQVAQPVEIWHTTVDQELEHHWAELLAQSPQFRIPIARFGSSDYHRSRSGRMFYSERRLKEISPCTEENARGRHSRSLRQSRAPGLAFFDWSA
jgi:Uri superfamily endonuclease